MRRLHVQNSVNVLSISCLCIRTGGLAKNSFNKRDIMLIVWKWMEEQITCKVLKVFTVAAYSVPIDKIMEKNE